MKILIKSAKIVNENEIFESDLLIENDLISKIENNISEENVDQIIYANGKYLLPGIIDDQVHFREPGLTWKGDIESESRAAIAGGITSFMEQPNTVPNAVTQELLEDKYKIAAEKSLSLEATSEAAVVNSTTSIVAKEMRIATTIIRCRRT